jgi:hypothetical protein
LYCVIQQARNTGRRRESHTRLQVAKVRRKQLRKALRQFAGNAWVYVGTVLARVVKRLWREGKLLIEYYGDKSIAKVFPTNVQLWTPARSSD